ncbi:hypothetical protein LSAT2_015064 [Lamellibrachia satsuma]|nr:hypothetical protein LSAT2_015064 [Lamellibrachia satsuma]
MSLYQPMKLGTMKRAMPGSHTLEDKPRHLPMTDTHPPDTCPRQTPAHDRHPSTRHPPNMDTCQRWTPACPRQTRGQPKTYTCQ